MCRFLHAQALNFFAIACASAATVTTVDNASPPDDGLTSLLEAIANVADGETISFNLPGTGPHYIVTPESSYPLITRAGVTIDGYSQPGSSANTAAPAQPRNEVIKVVLDSRTAVSAARRTVLAGITGFGDRESCVLGFRNAPGALVRGVAFTGVAGFDSPSDPYVYCIALIEASPNARIQGCWFGLDPAAAPWLPGPNGSVPGVHGSRSAVASFRGPGGVNSSGLVFGTDGNGISDAAEGNVSIAQRLAVHLETPNARVSGNWFNQFPTGTFLNPAQLTLEDGTMEAIENGDGANMLIGTNGDNVSDAIESNRFGPVVYTEFAQFWRAAHGVVFAGNHIGVDLLGLPAFRSPGTAVLFVRKDSSFRIGSDVNGVADAAEANHIHGLGDPFIRWSGNNNDLNGKPARISVRGNEFIGCAGRIYISSAVLTNTQRVFIDAMADTSMSDVILNPASTTSLLRGSTPPPAAGVARPVLDVYHAAPSGLYLGSVHGRVRRATFIVDGPEDLNPAPDEFAFDITAISITPAQLGQLTTAATYTLADGRKVTTNFSAVLTMPASPSPLADFKISRSGANAVLEWTGGTAPYRLLTAMEPAGPWSDLVTTSAVSFTTPIDAPKRFYRVTDNAVPSP